MAQFNIDTNIGGVIGQFQTFRSLITSLPGRLRTVVRSLRSLRVALVATGLGAIVVVLGSIIAAFSEWQPAIDFVNRQLAFLQGIITGLLREIREFITGIEESNQSILETARAARELQQASQDLRDAEIDLITVQAMRRVELSQLRLAAADQTLSEIERADALRQALVVQGEIFEAERELATERVRIAEETSAQAHDDAEAREALARTQEALILLDAMQADQARELAGVLSGLERIIAMKNQAQERNIGTTASAITTNNELVESEIEILNTAEMVTEGLRADQQARADIEAAKREAVRQTTDAQIEAAGALGDALTTFAGESKALAITGLLIEQAAGVAGIIVDTIRASAAALQPPPVGLGPVAGVPLATAIQIGGAAGVASTIGATVQGIQQINQAGGAAVGGVAGGGGASSVPFGPQVATPTISQGTTNMDTITGTQQDSTVVAVVASGEIQDANERNARTRNKRRFGG